MRVTIVTFQFWFISLFPEFRKRGSRRVYSYPANGWNGAPAVSADKESRRKAAEGLNDENGVNPPAKMSFLFPPSFIKIPLAGGGCSQARCVWAAKS